MTFYTNTVTLYNRYVDPDTGETSWYATLFEGSNAVHLVKTQGANITTSHLADADAAKLFIRSKNTPKPYIGPKLWAMLEDKTAAFTLGTEGDFFVEGDTTAEDATAEEFYESMKAKHDNVFVITTVDLYEHVLPHFEVGGK